MSAASDYLENALLDHVLSGGLSSFSAPDTVYLALFTASTGLEENNAITQSEVEGGTSGYARKAISFGDAASGSTSNSATVTFDAAEENWGTVTHVALMDSADGAGTNNVLFWGAVTTAKTIEAGDTFQVSSDNLTITLA